MRKKELKKNVAKFLHSVSQETIPSEDIRWTQQSFSQQTDDNFFNECIAVLKHHNIKNVLDISCGKGDFISLCTENGIDAYGVDPVQNNNDKVFLGTYSSIINSSRHLGEFRFDCISVQNVLHGNGHDKEELKSLFKFFRERAIYLLISDPVDEGAKPVRAEKYTNERRIVTYKSTLVDELKLLYTFKAIRGTWERQQVDHKLYLVT